MTRSRQRWTLAALATALGLGCPAPPVDPVVEPVTYPLEERPWTLLQASWDPLIPSAATFQAIEEGALKVTDLDRFSEHGLGVERVDGRPWVEQRELAPGFVQGTERSSLLYLWQAADPQIIDEESPIRFEAFDPLYRPHGHLTLQVFESHVRSAQRLSERSGRPFDFALLAGDLTDGSQLNELRWVLEALEGGVLDPDSGIDDDPVPGSGNDYNDPFISEGLSAPWFAALGNHETLYNGGFGAVTEELEAASVGSEIYQFPFFPNGFRDGSTPNAEVVSQGRTAADEARRVLGTVEVLRHLHEAGGEPHGHGLSPDAVEQGVAYFSVQPMENKPVRLVVLNTVNSDPSSIGVGSLGWLDREQFDWLDAELRAADAAHELVLVMSHHRPEDFAGSSPVTAEELVERLAVADGVVLHVVGHGHENEKRSVPDGGVVAGEHGYWQLMLASTVDFPMHSRILEVVHEGNGFLSIYATNLDHNAPTESLAHQARELAAAKRAFGTVDSDGDVEAFWAGDLPNQNLLLRIAISEELDASLSGHSWPSRIESEATLLELPGP
jgi:3',5'-cyclic AMP phosphodiesterase CpdA